MNNEASKLIVGGGMFPSVGAGAVDKLLKRGRRSGRFSLGRFLRLRDEDLHIGTASYLGHAHAAEAWGRHG